MALDLHDEFQAITAALEASGVEYAVVGALALAIHGVPRATTDIDVLVRPDDIDRVRDVVGELGYIVPAAPMNFTSGVTVHRLSRFDDGDHLTVDFLLATGALEDVWSMRMSVDTDSGTIQTLTREGLVHMKSLSGRLQDMADIERLQESE